MSGIEKDIIELLRNNQGLKAREIAEKLNMDKKDINSILYSSLRNQCYQDNSYVWRLKEASSQTGNNVTEEAPADKDLSKLCKYYLNCISLDENSGIKTFSQGQFGTDYIELKHVDFVTSDTEQAGKLFQKVRTQKNMSSYLGYPVMVEKITSRKNQQPYYFVAPVFLFSIDSTDGTIQKDELPRINMEVIKRYTSRDVNDQVYELIDLETQLGLNNPDADIEIDELVERLQSIRAWDWKEKLDADNLSELPPLPEVKEEGIYNRSILIISERSPYTQGLENELLQLSKISEASYRETALYKWIHNEIKHNYSQNADNGEQLLEVLPLNTEQYQAIVQSQKNDLTIVTGPPGTGKSQVVTNLLVNAAWYGKRVLFSSKNNKAVDVVDFRLNGLGQKPIMLRVGSGQYAFRLSELIEDLLSSNADISDQEEYSYFVNLYNEKSKEKKKLQDQKDQLVFLRNRIDRVEQEICTFRDYNGQYNKKTTDSDIDALKRASDNLTVAFLKSQKEKQPFFARIFWAAIEGKRKQALNDSIQNINPYLRKLNLPLVLENVNTDQINIIGNKIQEQIHFFEVISEYEALLEQLSSLDPLESIDNKLFILKKELANVAEKLWNKWLVTRPLQISAPDRREMAQFVAAMKLYGNGDISNDRELSSQFRKLQGKMSAHLPCWAVTSLSAHTRVPFTAGLFDLVVIDEASQCDIASALPLLYRAKRAVIIGDPKQLSHISSISDKQDATLLRKYDVGFDYSYSAMSLYAHASSIVDSQDIVILRDHHRSHADIIQFSNKEFYDGKLRVATNYDRLSLPQKSEPGIRWVDVIGNTERPSSGSAYNEKEASAVVNEIRRLVLDNQYKGSVGVVTPFRAQADKIRDLISKDDELNKYLLFNNDFLVDTVHKFQGDERDVMFFSATISRNALEGTIRFLSNTGNLFNVAITRARSMLIVVGDSKYCLSCNVKYLQNFVSYIQNLESGQRQNVNTYTAPTNEVYPNVSNPEEVSDWEKTLFTALYKAGIVTIPQYPVDKYKLDLALFDGERKLDIEVDGEMYHRDWNGELSYRDQLRNQRLYEMGWDVKRFWVYQVRDQLPQCVDQIRKWKEKA